MDRYLESYREMISLRGLTGHTLISYTTYIRAYLDYLQHVLHKLPEDVSWQEMRDFVRWLQRERSLSDRTVNCAVSQMRFFTLYVLHKPWDDTQLPMRRFDEYLPYVPSQQETWHFISTMPGLKQKAMVALMYSSGLRIGEVCSLRYEDVSRSRMRVFVRHGKNRQSRYAILSKAALDILTLYWRSCGRPQGYLFPKQSGKDEPIDTFFLLQAHPRPRAPPGLAGAHHLPLLPPCLRHPPLRERHRPAHHQGPHGAQVGLLHRRLCPPGRRWRGQRRRQSL